MAISPQGYTYGENPKSDHPFWDAIKSLVAKITCTASVDTSTGTPSVEVTKTETDDAINFDFAFSGLKGEKGDTGEQGADGAPGVSPSVESTGTTGSGELAGTITDADGNVISVYNGAQGEQGEAGSDADTVGLVSGVSVTNENGVYTINQTKKTETGEETTEAGSIEVPEVDTENVLAEINDEVVSNDTEGYDFHTLKETEYNGTVNEVGSFYLAQKQPIAPDISQNTHGYRNISQDGTITEDSVVDFGGDIGYRNDLRNMAVIGSTYIPLSKISRIETREYNRQHQLLLTEWQPTNSSDRPWGFERANYGITLLLNRSLTLPDATLTNITDNTSIVAVKIITNFYSTPFYGLGYRYLEGEAAHIVFSTKYWATSAALRYEIVGNIDFTATSNSCYLLGDGKARYNDITGITSIEFIGLN